MVKKKDTTYRYVIISSKFRLDTEGNEIGNLGPIILFDGASKDGQVINTAKKIIYKPYKKKKKLKIKEDQVYEFHLKPSLQRDTLEVKRAILKSDNKYGGKKDVVYEIRDIFNLGDNDSNEIKLIFLKKTK